MPIAPLQRVQLSCGPLACRQNGAGTPLLLIHGWRGSSSHWQHTLNSLADIRRMHAFDLPGHGGTPPRQTQLTAESLAQLSMDFADRSGLERFDLIGHSFGAAVAAVIASRWPERVRRLVMTSLGTARSPLEFDTLKQVHANMSMALPWWRPWLAMTRPWSVQSQPWIDWIVRQPGMSRSIAGPFFERLPASDAEVNEGVSEFLKTDPLSALETAISAGSPAFVDSVRGIKAPVFLISGDRDVIMPVTAVAALAEHLPNCRTLILDQCGHMPMIEQPERFQREVRRFLDETEAA